MKKKRVLIISDMHKTEKGYETLTSAIREHSPDFIILNGDICDFYRYKETENLQYIRDIIHLCQNKGKEWRYILGNHDIDMYLYFSRDEYLNKYAQYVKFEYCIGDMVFLHGHQAEAEEYDLDSSFWKIMLQRGYIWLKTRLLRLKYGDIDRLEEIACYIWDRRKHNGKEITEWIDTVYSGKTVIMGHTHKIEKNGVKTPNGNLYYNSGHGVIGDYLILEI